MLKRKMDLTQKRLSNKRILLVLLTFIVVLTSVIPLNNASAIEKLQEEIGKINPGRTY